MGLNRTMDAVSAGKRTPSTIPSFTALSLSHLYICTQHYSWTTISNSSKLNNKPINDFIDAVQQRYTLENATN